MKTPLQLLFILLLVICCTDELYAQRLWYRDADGDGLGSPLNPINSVSRPAGYVQNNLDCNDAFITTSDWKLLGAPGFSTNSIWATSIATDANNVVYAAYRDASGTASNKISVQKFVPGTGWATVGNANFSELEADPILKIAPDNTPYVAYYLQDPTGFLDREVVVRKYDPATNNWNTKVGSPVSLPTDIVNSTSFDIDKNGNLYIAYLANDLVYVKKYNGSNAWVLVGGPTDLPATNSSAISLSIGPDGTPYVAFNNDNDVANPHIISVKKFSGGTWQDVGSLPNANLNTIYLKVAETGEPFILYQDGNNAISVHKYAASAWQALGAPIKNGFIQSYSLVVDASGTPMIAWNTLSPPRCYQGVYDPASGWQTIAIVSNGATAVSMTFDNNGMPYVGYADASVGSKATVIGYAPIYTNPGKPTLIPSAGPYCSGSKITLTASGSLNDASNWVWYSDASFATSIGTGNKLDVSPLADATYYARGESTCVTQPTLNDHIDIHVNPLPDKPAIDPAGIKTICEGDHITLKTPLAASYLWSNGASTQSIDVAAAGDYTVKIKDAIGCESPASDPTTIKVNLAPDKPQIDPTGPVAICQGNSITLTANSTIASPVFTWSNTSTGDKITVNAAGSYSVKVTDGNGCSSLLSDATVVTVNPLPLAPTIAAGGSTTFCEGGSVILTASSSAASPTYIWSDGTQSTTLNVITSGSYTVQVKDANLCTSAASSATIVTVNPLPVAPTITAGSSTTFCAGGSVTLTANSSVPSPTYIWSDGTQATKLDVITPGSYTVKVKDANLCTSPESNAEVVKVNALPNKPTITASGSTTFCAGGTVTLTANSSVATPTYVWSNNTQATKIDVINSGSYTVKVRDANLCTSLASDAQIVTVNALPIAPTIAASGPTTFCAGGSVTLTAASSVASPTYIWNDGTQSATFNATKSGNYTVQVKDANSCTSLASNAAVVKVNALPTAPTIAASGSTTFCEGGSVTLTASSSVASPTYIWSGGTQGATLNVTKAGSYTVQVKDANLCTSIASAAQVVNVNALPTAPTITASGLTTFCAGGSVTLTANSSVVSPTYVWSDGTQGATFNVTKTGNYTVKVKDANQCTSLASAAQTVTVNALPAKPTITANTATTFCAGDSVKLIANSSVASPSYLWSDGASTPTLNVTKAGSYTVKVKDGNQCTSLASSAQVVTVNALPAKPTIAPGGPTTFCSGKSVVLTASSGVTSPSYIWSNGNTNTAITATASGNYSVKVKDANLCISPSSDTIQVTVNAVPLKPTISAAGPTTFCAGDSVVLKAASTTASPAYVWSNGKTGATITINTAGKYSVQVKDLGGCLSIPSDTQSVTVNALPARPTISHQGSDTLCAGDSVILIAASSVISPVYTWSNGVTGSSIKVSASGNYTVRVTDGNHCMSMASDTQRIKVNALPTAPAIAASGPTTACSGGSVILTASSGVASPVYVWSNGNTGATLTVTQSGNYTVKVKDANQCLSPASVATSVAISAPLAKPTIQPGGPTTFCTGDSVVLTASSTAASPAYMWSNGSTGKTITVLAGGNYAVQLKDSNGCVSPASDSVRIAVNSIPATPKITPATVLSFCQGDSVILKASAAITYLWNNQAGADTLIVRNGGTYTLTVQDANHCTSLPSQPVTVSVKPAPAKPVITSSGSLTFCQGDSVILQAPTASHYSWSNQSSASSITVNVGGDYTVKIQNDDGCWSPESAPATIKVNPFALATDITVRDTSSCAGAPATLTATSDIHGAVFSWYSDALLQNKVGTGSPFTTAPLSSNTTFYATVRGNGVCESKPAEAVVAKVALLTTPVLTVTPKQVTIAIGGSTQLTATGDGTIVWAPATGLDNPNSFTPKASPTATTTYTATLTNSGGCKATDTARVEVTIAYFDYNKLITPNGDGINDRLAFTDIAQYPDNKLEVFDRDGKLVYRKVGYNNEWDGRINGNVPPNNTYYFVLTVNGKVVKKGGVTIAH